MKGHLTHLAMCAPMIIIGIVLIVGGAGALGVLIPVAGCVLMMWLMMRMMMPHGGGHDGTHDPGRTS